MNNSTCVKCGNPFEMGTNGITDNGAEVCDSCANIVRTAEGFAFDRSAPFQVHRPIRNSGQGGARVRVGDVAILNPARKDGKA